MKYELQNDWTLPQKRQQRSDSPYCSTNKSNFVAFIWTSSSALTVSRNILKSLIHDQLEQNLLKLYRSSKFWEYSIKNWNLLVEMCETPQY